MTDDRNNGMGLLFHVIIMQKSQSWSFECDSERFMKMFIYLVFGVGKKDPDCCAEVHLIARFSNMSYICLMSLHERFENSMLLNDVVFVFHRRLMIWFIICDKFAQCSFYLFATSNMSFHVSPGCWHRHWIRNEFCSGRFHCRRICYFLEDRPSSFLFTSHFHFRAIFKALSKTVDLKEYGGVKKKHETQEHSAVLQYELLVLEK